MRLEGVGSPPEAGWRSKFVRIPLRDFSLKGPHGYPCTYGFPDRIRNARAQEMHEFVADKLAGTYPNDDRRSMFASFLSLAQSHHEAIMVLSLQEQLIGSAY